MVYACPVISLLLEEDRHLLDVGVLGLDLLNQSLFLVMRYQSIA